MPRSKRPTFSVRAEKVGRILSCTNSLREGAGASGQDPLPAARILAGRVQGRPWARRRRQLILEAPRVDRAGHDAAHLVVHADLPGQIPSSASGRPEGLTTIPVFVVSAVAAPPQASQGAGCGQIGG